MLPTFDANNGSKPAGYPKRSFRSFDAFSDQLRNTRTTASYQQGRRLISEMNSCLCSAMKLHKDQKFAFLSNEIASVRNTTTQDQLPDKKIVVTILEHLPLTEAEKSVLSKGLTFVL